MQFGFEKLFAEIYAEWHDNAKLNRVSSKLSASSGENDGKSISTWNFGMSKKLFRPTDFLITARVSFVDYQMVGKAVKAYQRKNAKPKAPLPPGASLEETILHDLPSKSIPIIMEPLRYNEFLYAGFARTDPLPLKVIYEVDESRKKNALLITANDATRTMLVVDHEHSGLEVFILPIASFVGGAVLSGLAYDLVKGLYQKAVDALKAYGRANGLREDQLDDLATKLADDIVITLSTADGTISGRFDRKRGIPRHFVNYLIRELQDHSGPKNQKSKS